MAPKRNRKGPRRQESNPDVDDDKGMQPTASGRRHMPPSARQRHGGRGQQEEGAASTRSYSEGPSDDRASRRGGRNRPMARTKSDVPQFKEEDYEGVAPRRSNSAGPAPGWDDDRRDHRRGIADRRDNRRDGTEPVGKARSAMGPVKSGASTGTDLSDSYFEERFRANRSIDSMEQPPELQRGSVVSVGTQIMKEITRTTEHLASKHLSEPLVNAELPLPHGELSKGKPKAKIILTHQSPHNLDCEPVCLLHVHFLIRVLPTGRITPRSELLVPALAAIQRRQEEVFCVKTYRHFESLRDQLTNDSKSKETSWGESHYIASLPELPHKSVTAQGCWARLCVGGRRNPDLEDSLQSFLNHMLGQLPQITSEPIVQRFFESDRVPVSYPLVQQVMQAQGGDFADV